MPCITVECIIWLVQLLFCCVTLLPLVRNQTEGIPVSVDLTAARVWKCVDPGGNVIRELQRRGYELELEVLNAREYWTEILTSTTNPAVLQSQGLRNCTIVAHLSRLIATELHENWRALKHHIPIEEHSSDNELVTQHVPDPQTDYGRHVVRRATVGSHSDKQDNDCHGREHADCGKRKGEKEEADKWFLSYHNLTETYRWFRQLALEHPSTVTVNVSIGKTHFGRDIMAVHITDGSASGNKPKIYLQCLLHAREWITGSVCMYIAKYLAAPEPSNLMLVNLLKRAEFIVVPVANPDGYYLTWLQYPRYRLWRKNVSPVNGSGCSGVDLNRNFDTHWSETGSSEDPCSELYHGAFAASEPEVQAIASYIQSNTPVLGAIDFHSYYQEILYPPAWTKNDAKDWSKLDYIAQWVAAAASEIGETYTYHKMNDIYLAAGTFPDWMLEYAQTSKSGNELPEDSRTVPHCVLPITVELRPKATPDSSYTGFMLPVSEILPTCQEMVPAIVKFAHLVLQTCSK